MQKKVPKRMQIKNPMYVAKYALTKGIIKVELSHMVPRYYSDGSITIRIGINFFRVNEDIFYTYDEAKKVAEQSRIKELERLKNMTFENVVTFGE